MTWILLVLAYGLLKGTREIAKKKAMGKNTVIEVLVFYTLLSFIFVLPDAPNAMGINAKALLPIAFKSFIIFVAWICSFKAISKLPISLVGILDMSRVIFASLLGYIVLHEAITLPKTVGLILVCLGLLLLKFAKRRGREQPPAKSNREPVSKMGEADKSNINYAADKLEADKSIKAHSHNDEEKNNTASASTKYIIMVLISCILNAVSGLMDKILMKSLTSSQLQFWYMLFLVIFYFIYVLLSRTRLNFKTLIKNYWIWALSLMFVVADRCLFIANGMADSKVTIMTLLKQSGCIVTILGGKFIFHEKNILYKLFCATIVIAGIVVAVL